MGVNGLKQIALGKAQPLSALLELTYRCSWRCVFCYNPRHHDVRRLSGSEWLTVLEDLRTLGTLTVTLTGGEPLTHPQFFDVAKSVGELRMAFRLFTNGALIDEETADRLAALSLGGVEMSLHGATAGVHDRATATPGSFEALLRALCRLRTREVRVQLKTPLTRLNEHEVEGMIALAKSLAVPYQIDPALTPRDDGDRGPLGYAASRQAVLAVMKHQSLVSQLVPLERTAGSANCGLGRITLAVDPEGNVYPCPQWRHQSLGNVRVTRLSDLWHGSATRQGVAQVSVAANDKLFQLGGATSRFEFCPALAFQHAGDPLALDSSFVERAELAIEALGESS